MLSGDSLKNKISFACLNASRILTAQLKDDISVFMPEIETLETVSDKWGKNPFDWSGYNFADNEYCCQFKLAVSCNKRICGLVRNSYEKDESYNSLIIERIQGNPDKNHPLKGIIVTAFSVANLEVAKIIKASSVYVEDPKEETLHLYSRLGYRTGYLTHNGLHEAELSVTSRKTISFPTCQK